MKALITSNPPLSQVTTTKGTTVEFTVLLEIDESHRSEAWELRLWYSHGVEWQECCLNPSHTHPTVLQTSSSPAFHRLYFTTKLDMSSFLTFTIKFRSGPGQPWNWVNDHQRTIDGIVILESKTNQVEDVDLGDLIEDLNSMFETRKVISDTPRTTVWSVATHVEAAIGDKSASVEIKFGSPWGGEILRYE